MARLRLRKSEGTLYAYLEGEVDHHSAQPVREQVDAQVLSQTPEKLVMDFSGVTFMDSSAVGLILGRNTMMKVMGGKLYIQNPPHQLERILKMAQISTEKMLDEVYIK